MPARAAPSAGSLARFEQSVLVLDHEGHVVAASDEARELIGGHGDVIRERVRRSLDAGIPVQLAIDTARGQWRGHVVPAFSTAGKPIAVLALGRVQSGAGADVSERYAALCRLVSGVVHEMRNPLASISLTAELLGRRDDMAADSGEKLDEIVQHVDRAEELLGTFRRISREDEELVALISLNDLAQDAIRLENRALSVAEAEVVLELDAELPSILADAAQLRLVLANLIRNAAEAMIESRLGGRVTIASSHRHGVVRLSVEDDGPGITPEVRSRLFDAYFTTKVAGTGLGLAMCQGVVKAHGGHIWVESGRRRGARFYVDLPDPRHSTPAWHQSLLGVDLANAPSRSALIVEPDVERLERLRQAVASAGFKVHVAADAPVALRKLRAADFDALLIGGASGLDAPIDLCSRASVLSPELCGRLGVVCTTEPAPADRLRLERAGARLMVGDRDVEALSQFVRELAEPAAADAVSP